MSAKSEMFREGRRRLQEWLPAAREVVAREGHQRSVEARSPIGAAAVRYVTEENLDAIVIYPAPLGGWHADIVLKKVPPGVSDAFGTPAATPCATRKEAEAAGRRLLEFCLVQEAQNRAETAPPPPPGFQLYDWDIKLGAKVFEKGIELAPDFAKGYGSQQKALDRIEDVLALLSAKGFGVESFDKWPRDTQNVLLAVLHIAALSGVMRYPPNKQGKPEGEHEKWGVPL